MGIAIPPSISSPNWLSCCEPPGRSCCQPARLDVDHDFNLSDTSPTNGNAQVIATGVTALLDNSTSALVIRTLRYPTIQIHQPPLRFEGDRE